METSSPEMWRVWTLPVRDRLRTAFSWNVNEHDSRSTVKPMTRQNWTHTSAVCELKHEERAWNDFSAGNYVEENISRISSKTSGSYFNTKSKESMRISKGNVINYHDYNVTKQYSKDSYDSNVLECFARFIFYSFEKFGQNRSNTVWKIQFQDLAKTMACISFKSDRRYCRWVWERER